MKKDEVIAKAYDYMPKEVSTGIKEDSAWTFNPLACVVQFFKNLVKKFK